MNAAVGILAFVVLGCQTPPEEPAPFVDATPITGMGARATPAYDAALADVDDDGDVDIYLGNHGAGAALWRHANGFRFTNDIAASGIDPGDDQHGVAFGDADGDGRVDLYVGLGADRGTATKANRLWAARGDGAFADIATTAGVTDPSGRARGTTWVDIDRDGRLDLFVGNYATPNALFRNRGDGTFQDVATTAGLARPSAIRSVWTDLDADGAIDVLFSATAKGMRFFRNRGDGTFEDETARRQLPTASAQGAAFGDLDGDGDLDLVVAHGNDFPASLVVRDGWATFAAFPEGPGDLLALRTTGGAIPEVTLWDQGVPATAPFACEAERCRLAWPGKAARLVGRIGPNVREGETTGYRPWRPRTRHHLFRQHDDGTFGDPEPLPGPPGNGQGVALGDLDNDGDLDVVIVQSGVEGADEPDVVLANDGSGHFRRTVVAAGDGRGCGAHLADFDDDGRLDLLVTAGWGMPPVATGRSRIFRNTTTGGRSLHVTLRGTTSNRFGIGARVLVEAGGRHIVREQVGSGLYSQSALPIHVGIADAASARVTVQWPSGQRTAVEVSDPHTRGSITIVE